MPDLRYQIDSATGLITPARQCPSPNFDARPEGSIAELIVVHAISLPPGDYTSDAVSDFFQNRLRIEAHPYYQEIEGMRVSAHVFIRRDGHVVQFVSLNDRAWHAGESNYCGRQRCNDYSVGIELEGTDDTAFTDAQYNCLNAAIRALRSTYTGLAVAPVVGHSDIAPGRKKDPGSKFQWSRIEAANRPAT